jgi:hypothetical protein
VGRHGFRRSPTGRCGQASIRAPSADLYTSYMSINMKEVVVPYLVAWFLGLPAFVLLLMWLFVH